MHSAGLSNPSHPPCPAPNRPHPTPDFISVNVCVGSCRFFTELPSSSPCHSPVYLQLFVFQPPKPPPHPHHPHHPQTSGSGIYLSATVPKAGICVKRRRRREEGGGGPPGTACFSPGQLGVKTPPPPTTSPTPVDLVDKPRHHAVFHLFAPENFPFVPLN